MGKTSVVLRLMDSGALGIIRVKGTQDLVQIAKALYAGGLYCLEITMTTPGALRAIEDA
ncbi:MAG: 2-dehydro-3-deoxyphosphogluconate aldolase, partial [Chloroflexi bacterium]